MGWELGGGLGHVRRLLDLAQPIAARGHKIVFAVRNLRETAPLFDGLPFSCVQAPYYTGRSSTRPRAPFRAASYTDVLAVCGFADAADLLARVRAWEGLTDLARPQLIVADHSPTLCLAAYGAQPIVNVGNGFVIPPADGSEFPVLSDDTVPVASDGDLLDIVRQVQH